MPFIKENGLSWVLPLHETVETFLAGTIFAVASNFILIGSTKLITVIFTYADIVIGFPFRVIGGFGWKRLEDKAIGAIPEDPNEPARPWWKGPKPRPDVEIDEIIAANSDTRSAQAQLAVFGLMLGWGRVSNSLRQGIEALDLFVGRYLLLTTVGYVGIKFVHYKIFDPFAFL